VQLRAALQADEFEPLIYNSDLMEWLKDDPNAPEAMENAVDMGYADDKKEYTFFGHLQAANADYRRSIALRIFQEFERKPEEVEAV
jgi:hypothetical protein